MTTTIPGRDYTAANLPAPLPGIQLASYITGGPGIVMSEAQETAHPGIIRIAQTPFNPSADVAAIIATADVLDFENGAATLSDLAPWITAANENFAKGTRPGQRKPAIYVSASSLPSVISELDSKGIKGCGIWVAHWGVAATTAQYTVSSSVGSFPVIGFQFANSGNYDNDYFSVEWLNTVSVKPVVTPPPTSTGVPAAVTWQGDAGLVTRHTVFTREQWDTIKWVTP